MDPKNGGKKMWLDRPQAPETKPLVQLIRPQAGSEVKGEIIGTPLRVFVHFAAGRSWPCTGFKCCLCAKGIPRRFYAYYPVIGKSGKVGIFELTAQAESQLLSQMEPVSQVPCGWVSIRRPPGRRNLPCAVTWEEPDEYKNRGSSTDTDKQNRTCATLTENEMKTSLMRIWNLPSMNGEEEENEYLDKLNEAIRLKTNKNTSHHH